MDKGYYKYTRAYMYHVLDAGRTLSVHLWNKAEISSFTSMMRMGGEL